MAGGKAGKDSGKTKQKAVSRSARAGLQFPVGRLGDIKNHSDFSFFSYLAFQIKKNPPSYSSSMTILL